MWCIEVNYCGVFSSGAEPEEWRGIVKKVMKMDNSWNNAAGKYIDVYNSVRVRFNN